MSSLMNFKVFEKSLNDIDILNCRIINTINPHSYCMTKKDAEFKHVLQNSDILLPDGVGIVWASKVLNQKKIKKIAGFDIFTHLMNKLNATSGSCFFLGASESTLELIHERTKVDYPNITVNSYSPPYKKAFSAEDNALMIQKINAHSPDIVFVGMTAPKQEKWGFENKDQINASVICSIGAVFDFYAGTVKRSSDFWIKIGLEWLPRFIQEPKRLAERNLVSTPKFILEVFSYKLRGRGM